MSIQNKRLNMIVDNILKEELQKGNLPSSKEFVWRLNNALYNRKLNMPFYKFKPYKNTEIVESARLNEQNDEIHQDLSILYNNIVDVNNSLAKYENSFEVEKEKIENEIEVQENYLKEMIFKHNDGGYLGYSYETFDDLDKTDLSNSQDVFVDTKNKELKIVEEKNTSTKIIPKTDIQFRIVEQPKKKEEETITGTPQRLLEEVEDEEDKVWQKQISLDNNQALTGYLEVQMDKEYPINKIDMDMINIKNTFVKVTFSKDGQTWFDIPYHEDKKEVDKTFSLSFPTLNMRMIRIVIEKKEADELIPSKENLDYKYLFGMKNIALYNKNYPTYGRFQSEPHEVINGPTNYIVDTVRLSADELVPTNTSIDYEIALKREDNVLDWHFIDPMERINPKYPTSINFSNIKKDETIPLYFPSDLSVVQSEAEDLRRNGIPIYRLTSDHGDKSNMYIEYKKIVDGSMKLFAGRDNWEVTSYPSEDVEGTPTIEDWKKVKDRTEINYEEMPRTKSGDLFVNHVDPQSRKYLCRLGFFVSSADTIVKTIPISTDPIAIYLNGDLLFEGETSINDEINLSVRHGWNEIVVLINGKNATSVNGISTSLGFNLYSIADRVYSSSKPLTYIPLFDLQYNTKANDRTVFSSREEEGKKIQILTNFGKPGLKFDLVCDYAEEMLTDEEPEVLLRATFRRDNGDSIPSPVLNKYRLEYK
ncbi:hypothetical protein [Tetragenococcus halophilus]|uniref:hypothetical protein n=1 Tax=Tetragenococcus halophilus TaxID=51669 RepID=UPI0030F1E6B1